MPTKWLQERANGSKNEHGIPPPRAFCGCVGGRGSRLCDGGGSLGFQVSGSLELKVPGVGSLGLRDVTGEWGVLSGGDIGSRFKGLGLGR